jgi:hypothetical protein
MRVDFVMLQSLLRRTRLALALLRRYDGLMSRKDECYGPLDAASEQRAAEAYEAGSLDLHDGKLHCDGCGAMVGAQRVPRHMYSSEEAYEAHPRFRPNPYPPQRPKPVRSIPRKPGGGKRF